MTATPWELTRESFLSEDEVARLLAHLRQVEQESSDRSAAATDRVIIETLLFSGVRNTEFCRLLIADTCIATGRPEFQVSERPGEVRTVHLPRSLCELLESYVREFHPQRLPAGVRPDDIEQPLILNERGKPYERTALYRRVVRILSAAGLAERASVQLLRHTYGYIAYKRTGGNLLFVQQQLGHAHPMVTAIYAQFVPFNQPDLANAVAERP